MSKIADMHLEVARKNIKKLVKTSELNQTKLGDILGVVQSQVSMLLKGQRKLKMDQLFEIAEALGISVQELITPAKNIEDMKLRLKFARIANNKHKLDKTTWGMIENMINTIDDSKLHD